MSPRDVCSSMLTGSESAGGRCVNMAFLGVCAGTFYFVAFWSIFPFFMFWCFLICFFVLFVGVVFRSFCVLCLNFLLLLFD